MRVIVDVLAQGMIQSGRYSPSAEKFVAMCLPSTKSEKAAEVGGAEYEPMVQVMRLSLMVTAGLLVGSIGSTCARPDTELDIVENPDFEVVTVTETVWSGRNPFTEINPVELIETDPALEVAEYVNVGS